MISKYAAEYLSERKDLLDQLGKVLTERDAKIRELLKNKQATVIEIAALTGMTRGRIYQIRDEPPKRV